MTIYQWFCLFGVPAILAGIFKFLHSFIKKKRMYTRRYNGRKGGNW